MKNMNEKPTELEKSEKRFRALLENNNDGISMHDCNGTLFYLSPATERIIGFTLEDTRDMVAIDFFHPDELEDVSLQFEMAMKNPGVPIPGINRLLHKDGHYVWTEGTTTNLLDDENVRATVGNFRDITDRKIAEEKILKANRLYSFLSHINQAIVHHRDELALLNEV